MDDVSDELARVRRSQHGLARNWNECRAENEALEMRICEPEVALEECQFERNVLRVFSAIVVVVAIAAYRLLWVN